MRYSDFKTWVDENALSVPVLRCDVPPSQIVLDMMEEIGLGEYEHHVERMIEEHTDVCSDTCNCRICVPRPYFAHQHWAEKVVW